MSEGLSTERREYELTDEQFDRLVEAAKPVPYIVVGGVPPMSQQQRANNAWQTLGRELGFDWKSVQPHPSGDQRRFIATPFAPDPGPEDLAA